MSQNNNRDRDTWVHHNRDRLSEAQMEELRKKDANIDQRLQELETSGIKRDPTVKVPSIDDAQVQAPQVAANSSSGRGWWFIGFLLLAGSIAYLFFFVPLFPPRRTT